MSFKCIIKSYFHRVNETSYFPYFKFIFDENLVCSERKWDRLPTMIRLTL